MAPTTARVPQFLFAAFISLTLTIATFAQSSIGISIDNPSSQFRPEFSSRDIQTLARALKLGPAEREAFESLYAGHADQLAQRRRAVAREFVRVAERAETLQDATPIYESSASGKEKREKYNAEATTLKEAFLTDLRSLLSSEQSDRWPIAEREIRRVKLLGEGRLPSESVDLIALVEDAFPDAMSTPALLEALENYAAELDRALMARSEFLEKQGPKFSELCTAQPPDVAGATSLWKDSQRIRTNLRDINRRHVQRIADTLGSNDLRTRLDRLFFEKSYPQLIAETISERFITRVESLPNLNNDQRTQITQIAEPFREQRLRLLKETAAVEDDLALSQMPVSLLKITRGDTDDGSWSFNGKLDLPQDHPIRALRERRLQLARSTRDRLESALTPEQLDEASKEDKNMVLIQDFTPWGL
jgi:hypothetical protein